MRLPFKIPPTFLAPVYRAWSATMPDKHIHREKLESNHPAIVCMWHDELFSGAAMKKNLKYMALISNTRDGNYLAAVMEHFGFLAVRGSSSKGGAGALHELVHRLKYENYGTSITVDGPRGPRHKAKSGAIWLSVQSGRPIVPVRMFYKHTITFGSWDKFQLPLPFSTVTTVYGDPWYPNVDTDNHEALRDACRELEDRLNAVELTYFEAQKKNASA